MELQLAEDAAHRIASENTALKIRIRELTQTNRGLEDRLSAARSNNRFLDKDWDENEVFSAGE